MPTLFSAFSDEVNQIKLAAPKEDNSVVTGTGMAAGGLGSAVIGGRRTLSQLSASPDQGEIYQKLKQQAKKKGTEVYEDGGLMANYITDELAAKAIGAPVGSVHVSGGLKRPSILAHELGHASIGRTRLGKFIQNTPTGILGKLGRDPLIGGVIGAATGASENEKVRDLGKWAPLIVSAPNLAYEGGASLIGLRNLRRLGVKGKAFREAAKDMLSGFSTYAGGTALGTGAAHVGSGLVNVPKVEKKAYATSQYSGPLSYGGFKQESAIPPFKNPALKTAGPPAPKEKKADWGEWAGDNEMQGTHFQQESGIPPFKNPKLKQKEKRAYDPSPVKGPGTLGNVDVPGMRKMRTPARALQQSKGVADFKEVKPDAKKALSIKLPTIGSPV